MKKLAIFVLASVAFGQATHNDTNQTSIDGIIYGQSNATQASILDDFLIFNTTSYGGTGLGWVHSGNGSYVTNTANNDWVYGASLAGTTGQSIAGHPGITACRFSANSSRCALGSIAVQNAADLWRGVVLEDLEDYTTPATGWKTAEAQVGFTTNGGSTFPCVVSLNNVGGCYPGMFVQVANAGSYVNWFVWACTASATCDTAADTGVVSNNGWWAIEIAHLECVPAGSCSTTNTFGVKLATTLAGLASVGYTCISTRSSGLPAACSQGTNTTSATHLQTTGNVNFFTQMNIPATGQGDSYVVNLDLMGIAVTGLTR